MNGPFQFTIAGQPADCYHCSKATLLRRTFQGETWPVCQECRREDDALVALAGF